MKSTTPEASVALLPILLLLSIAPQAGAKPKAADADTIRMVEFFVKSPIADLPPQHVERFMAVDVEALPAKLRPRYKARRLELHALKHIAAGNRKGTVRTPEADCAIPAEAKDDDPDTLKMAGFAELQEDEAHHLQEKTKCSERELMCEFSLQIVVVRDRKTQKVRRRRYYLHENDPLFALVAGYRNGKNIGGNTQFFGRASALCAH